MDNMTKQIINSKTLFKRRFIFLIIFLVLSLIVSGIYSWIVSESNIQKSSFTIYLNEDTQEIFKGHFDGNKKFYKYYTYETASTPDNSDLVFTSDISMIDTTRDYSIEGYSPLVVCLKNTKNLNNYLKTTTKEGFLTCSSSNKIKNSVLDVISCDFSRIIEAVLNGDDWSDLGGEDKKITIYCPESNTIAGNLFYEFLLITINDGKYPSDNIEQIKEKANMFLDSPNTIQTDVKAKISKLSGVLQEEDIYILFESDLISATDGEGKISVTYPETTVVRQLYIQYNNPELSEKILATFKDDSWSNEDLSRELRYDYYYRSSGYPKLDEYNKYYNYYPDYFNVQEGFNYYELTD